MPNYTRMGDNTLGKIKVLDRPLALPGECIVCRYGGGDGDDSRKFIDFDFDIEFYGTVYFCSVCITSIFNQLGFLNPEQYEELVERLSVSEGSTSRLLVENASLRSAISALSNDSFDFGVVANSSSVEQHESHADGINSESESIDRKAEPSDSEQGRDNVSATSSGDHSGIFTI